MQATVFDVAQYILKQRGQMTTLKLQKLVYYCQAWSLVWDERPLFQEKIYAWANGPVVRDLYNAHKGFFEIADLPQGKIENLDTRARETIDAVLNFYGNKTAQYLADLTHLETPWKKAREGYPEGAYSDVEITTASMAEYYSSLLPKAK